jgi:hypothetical protein
MLPRLLELACAPVELAEAEVAVGDEGAHPLLDVAASSVDATEGLVDGTPILGAPPARPIPSWPPYSTALARKIHER